MSGNEVWDCESGVLALGHEFDASALLAGRLRAFCCASALLSCRSLYLRLGLALTLLCHSRYHFLCQSLVSSLRAASRYYYSFLGRLASI
eukprot:6204879-Pleurochrysis_carterae.AAC.3